MLSRPTSLVFGNSTATTLTYDTDSQDWSYAQNLASTPQDVTVAFTRSASAQTLTRNLSNPLYDYDVPTLNQSYTRNGLNQYTAVGGVGFSYSGGDGQRGNLTSDGARSFTYDLENRLLSVTGSPGLTLTYDPLGRLRTTVSGGTTTTFLYSGDQLVAEYETSTLVDRYAFGAGVDRPITWYEGSALTTRNWLHADELGSVIATSNNSGVATIYTYGPYGEPNTWTGLRFRYTGQIALPEVQLYHYKARVYDPRLGRFLQIDPVGYEDSLNLYTYVRNDPINAFDPTGRDTRMRVMAYRIRGAAGAAGYGHGFVRYEDTESDRSRISRAGPGPDGDILAQDDPLIGSIDLTEPIERDLDVYTVFETTVDSDFDDVQEALTDFNRAVNDADSDYRSGAFGQDPNNSNNYTTDAVKAVIGIDIANTSPLKLLGFGEPLDNVEQPVPLVDRDAIE